MEGEKEFKYLRIVWRNGRRNKSEGCESQGLRVICNDYERKDCIHGGKEKVKGTLTIFWRKSEEKKFIENKVM